MNLYPHQITGVEWLQQRTRAGLFDDMGLGKTITAIVAAQKAGVDSMLVIAPTVVAWNWAREIQRWSHRQVFVLDSAAKLARADEASMLGAVIVTTHGLTISKPVFEWLRIVKWDLVVLDEAHLFRNASAKRTRAFYGTGGIVHRANRVWLLTGTPMPNNSAELWPHLRGLWPDRCPYSFEAFRKEFCELEWSPFTNDWKVIGNKNLPGLRALIDGLFLRRLKSQHLDLPAIRWETVVLPSGDVPPRLAEIDAEFAGLPMEEVLEHLRRSTEFAEWRHLCGVAKIASTVELLQQDDLPKVVVFAHHLDVLDGIEAGLGAANCIKITGEVSAADRQELVDCFQRLDVRYALCQITAGGTGITLTAASEVVFVELSFVPGDNKQAADRCHRIGQTEPVRVRVLSLANTVDELTSEILARKTAMIGEVLGEKV